MLLLKVIPFFLCRKYAVLETQIENTGNHQLGHTIVLNSERTEATMDLTPMSR